MIVLPPSLLIDKIFRMSRPRRSAAERQAEEHLERVRQTFGSTRKAKKKRSLPHWCIYVGWLLVLAAAGTSAFMVFSYRWVEVVTGGWRWGGSSGGNGGCGRCLRETMCLFCVVWIVRFG